MRWGRVCPTCAKSRPLMIAHRPWAPICPQDANCQAGGRARGEDVRCPGQPSHGSGAKMESTDQQSRVMGRHPCPLGDRIPCTMIDGDFGASKRKHQARRPGWRPRASNPPEISRDDPRQPTPKTTDSCFRPLGAPTKRRGA